MLNDIREIVIQSFEMCTQITLDECEGVPLKDLPIESMNFVAFVVELESRLSITLPEEYLLINQLPDLITFAQIVENLYYAQHDQEL